ncbi:glycosyltransferase family 4 protein [Flavobacterium lacisediminis]|uniref:Glycosyltransferase family 4 protein n=1 Tax=Flavobacterium lacisediminis TaxID=2989705 RepID=A0ABT3EHF5_9FLAO|nr:glycosyltransferase family 4 protein [Flavobacterium lacisediminis]MCW1147826.1 glycosyltransferase family 4 protein [Flavobacterium lacisediminis]
MKILYLGNRLSKHGYNKTTIETLGLQLEQEGIYVFYASEKKSFPLRMLDMMWSVILYHKQVSYILIDTYSTKAFWYAFLCSQLASFFNVKYIPILHGGDLPNRLKKNPTLSKKVFANAYKNVAPSEYLKQAFEKEGFDNVIHIPNAIEIEKYEFKVRTELAPKLLWVRAFSSIYNPKMAVKVLKQLQEKYPSATLTMVGPDKDGSLQTTKDFAESMGVSVDFTGQLTKEEWWKLASKHDIFINTTHFDNTPVSVMEAMALGLPVISTKVGGIPFLLTDEVNALLIPDNDTTAMTKAVLDLLENKSKSNLLITNARTFIEQMNWELVKQSWVSLLK